MQREYETVGKEDQRGERKKTRKKGAFRNDVKGLDPKKEKQGGKMRAGGWEKHWGEKSLFKGFKMTNYVVKK